MWQVSGVLAGIERSLISARTRARVKAAQRRGLKFGPKPSLTPEWIDLLRLWPPLVSRGDFFLVV